MSILSRFGKLILDALVAPEYRGLARLETKTSPTVWQLLSEQYDTRHGIFPEQQLDQLCSVYGMQVWVYAAVYAIASNLAGCKAWIYRFNKDGEKEYLESGPAFDLINNPNEDDTFEELLEKMVTYNELVGWSHLELGRRGNSGAGKIEKLYPLESWRMLPIVDSEGIAAWEYRVNGKWQRFEKEEIYFQRYFNPNNELFGLSPVHVIYNPVLRALYQEKWAINFFKKGAIPPAVMVFPKDEVVDEKEVAEYKARWKKNYGGIEQSQEIAILTGGADLKLLQQSIRDMDMSRSERSVQEQILAAFGVPPIYVGIVESSKYQTSPEQKKIFWEQNIIPKKRRIENRFSQKILLLMEPGTYLELDTNHVDVLREGQNEKVERYIKGLRHGAITRNELRIECYELDPSEAPGMDAYWMETGLIQLSSGKKEEPPVTPPAEPETEPAEEETEQEKRELSLLTLPGNNGNGAKLMKSMDSILEQLTNLAKIEIDDPWAYGGELHRKAMSKFERETATVEKQMEKFWELELRKMVNGYIEILNTKAVTESNFILDPELYGRIFKRAKKIYQDLYEHIFFVTDDIMESQLKAAFKEKKKVKAADPAGTGRGEISAALTIEDIYAAIADNPELKDLIGFTQLMQHAENLAGIDLKKLSTGVADTLTAELKEGLAQGDGMRGIAKRFKNAVPDLTDIQVKRIARTSATQCYNESALARYETSNQKAGFDIVEGKRWLAALDTRTRDTHVAAHGQIVALKDKFIVGNEHMDQPGDPSGGPAENYNCRCTITPVLNLEEGE